MANRSIILSNGDGRVTFSNTSSIWYDDVTLTITGSAISAGSLTLPSIEANKLIYVSGGSILPVVTGTVNNGALVWNATTSQWSASSDIVEYYAGTAGGDLSGTFGTQNFPKVTNISNVSSGTLSAFYGGTGANIPTGSNILLKATSGSFSYLSASAASSGSLVTATSTNGWTIAPPAYQPDVRFYTSGSTGNTFTWTKPAGARFARVILQGAGGGGGSYRTATVSGAGGGSGGYTDIIIDLANITNTVIVTVGIGGLGTFVTNTPPPGGSTTFGSYYSAGGGGGGVGFGAASSAPGGIAGVGLTKNGGSGCPPQSSTSAVTVVGMPSGGGRFGGTPGTIVPIFQNSQKNFGYTLDSAGGTINITLSSGSVGSNGSTPAKPGYGAGGGGAMGTVSIGGDGGDGYALIISW